MRKEIGLSGNGIELVKHQYNKGKQGKFVGENTNKEWCFVQEANPLLVFSPTILRKFFSRNI